MHLTTMKCGQRIYKGLPIPIVAKIQTSELGREFYVTSITMEIMTIRFIDDGSFKNIKYNEKYLV